MSRSNRLSAPEHDPHGKSAHEPGAKLDANKPIAGVLLDFSRALSAVVEVGTYGANKYSRGGWRCVADGKTRYTDAMVRHLLAENIDGGAVDPESNLLHAAHLAWNALARLEFMLKESEK